MPFRYRQFPVYRAALEFHGFVVRITAAFPKEFDYLRQQMRRASLSIVLNIAEGSAKNSDKDFNRYLLISLGSVDETMAGGEVSLNEKLITNQMFTELQEKALSIGKQLGGFSNKLKRS